MFFSSTNSVSDCLSGYIIETSSCSLASASVQGRRLNNEDAEDHLFTEKYSFFAIYDGHGGDTCSAYLKRHLLEELAALDEITPEKIKQIYRRIDLGYRKVFTSAGSTAIVAIMNNENQKLMVVNLGDSRAMIIRDRELVYETTDHTPDSERKRIEDAGYHVFDNRVNGSLALARAFGDFEFKEDPLDIDSYGVSIIPEISEWIQLKKDDLIVLNCDGLNEWDNTNRKVANFISSDMKVGNNLMGTVMKTIAHSLKDSMDNISLMIVKITDNENPSPKKNIYVPGMTKSLRTNYRRTVSYIQTGKKNDVELKDALSIRKKLISDFFDDKLEHHIHGFFVTRYEDSLEQLREEYNQLLDPVWATKLIKKISEDSSDDDDFT